MKTIDWRGEYLAYDYSDIKETGKYMSISALAAGTGTRENPYSQSKILTTETKLVVGNGIVDVTLNNTTASATIDIVGQSKTDTILSRLTWYNATQLSNVVMRITNLKVRSLNAVTIWGKGTILRARDCIFDNPAVYPTNLINNNADSGSYIKNSIYYITPIITAADNNIIANFCTFIKCISNINILKTTTPLLSQCEVNIVQTAIDTYYTKYVAFDNCKFRIGNEPTATALSGNNANELRENFINRCTAQSLTVKSANDDNLNTPVDRWIFSNKSISGDYNTIKNSEIDVFSRNKGIYFGHTDKTVNPIPITTTPNIPASFTTTPVSNSLVQNNSIGLFSSSSINTRINAYADSKIIWLGGLSKLTTLALNHNLPIEAGVSTDSVFGLSKIDMERDSIEAGCHYIVRSTNDSLATIKYNNVEYTSSLITRKNVFLATSTKTFENISGNAEIYQVLDFANHQSLQIRIIRELPTPQITTGNLQAGYWYFVEPDNLSDTSGSVTYKGIVRPAFDSFLVDSANLTFTAPNKAHLRRCWKQDFDFTTETTDKSFWTDRQKPNYFDVVSDDLRCLLKNNSSASTELATGEDGMYIGSGHPEFYSNVNGINGLKLPAYNIVGAYLQIRVPITTINPM